jgi:hypothetical protein
MRAVHNASIALAGPQTYSSNVGCGQLVGMPATKASAYRHHLRSRELHKLIPIRPERVLVFGVGLLLWILAMSEGNGLIAKKGPP